MKEFEECKLASTLKDMYVGVLLEVEYLDLSQIKESAAVLKV